MRTHIPSISTRFCSFVVRLRVVIALPHSKLQKKNINLSQFLLFLNTSSFECLSLPKREDLIVTTRKEHLLEKPTSGDLDSGKTKKICFRLKPAVKIF